jgi:hypothetical protein
MNTHTHGREHLAVSAPRRQLLLAAAIGVGGLA